MSNVPLTDSLRSEYANLFTTCEVSASIRTALEGVVDQIAQNRPRYQTVGDPLGIPWFFVGAIHHMEASLNFHTHLHNGDPLTARTVHVPAGRPAAGSPPFTWEESATDALTLEGLENVTEWTTPGILYQMEKYNGFGYRTFHPQVLTPYLWSGSNHYTKGKYVADGTFDPDAVSNQIGAAVVMRRMAERQLIQFDSAGNPVLTAVDPEAQVESIGPRVVFSNTQSSTEAELLQAALNEFPGIFLREDGVPGTRTSDAFKTVTGHFLMGDPRADS